MEKKKKEMKVKGEVADLQKICTHGSSFVPSTPVEEKGRG